jgi:rare lipoprotein A
VSRTTTIIVILAAAATLAGCASTGHRGGVEEVGVASWYDPGRRRVGGVVYDGSDLTAAHRSLPYGTRARVTNLENGRRVTVVVNDRGPFVRGRVIDVSKAAAARLGIVRSGLARVRVEAPRPAAPPAARRRWWWPFGRA